MKFVCLLGNVTALMVLVGGCTQENEAPRRRNADFFPLMVAAGGGDTTAAVVCALSLASSLWFTEMDALLVGEMLDCAGGAGVPCSFGATGGAVEDGWQVRYGALRAALTGDMHHAAHSFYAAYQRWSCANDLLLAARCVVNTPDGAFRSNVLAQYYTRSDNVQMSDAIRNMDSLRHHNYESVLAVSQRYPDTALFYYQKILALWGLKRYKEAVAPARWLIEKGLGDAASLCLAGRAAFLAKDYHLAYRAFRNLHAGELDSPELLDMARSSAFMCKQWYDVIRFGERLLQLQPNKDAHYPPLIMAYAHTGRYDAANRRLWEYSQRHFSDATNAYRRWMP